MFFSELFDKQSNKLDGEFTQQLKDYTQSALSKFNKLGGSWTFDHELMLNSVL